MQQNRGTTTATARQHRLGNGRKRIGSKVWGRRGGAADYHRGGIIEALESRQLLTTLYGGGAGQAAVYTYTTAGATVPAVPTAQITIFGNVVAEFIFADGAGTVVNRPVTFFGPDPNVNSGLGGTIASDVGLDLFAVYVSQSDINSYIAINEIGNTPSFGSATSITIVPANPKASTITASSGSGSLRLGALTGGTTGAAVIKTDINGAAIGVRPAGLDDLPEDPNADLSAGLRVANGNDLGKFLFDGEVFGKVRVDGSMNTFYAGWLLTGDARGADMGFSNGSGLPESLVDNFVTPEDIALGAFSHIVPRQNFYVGGDIQNILSDGAIGWDATFGDADPDTAPFFLSGVDIYVRGRAGWIHGNEGNTASVTVLNMDPAVAGFTRPTVYQEEVEGWWHFPGAGIQGDVLSNGGFPNLGGTFFEGGVLRAPRTGRDVVPFQNDTFDSFQILNSFNSRNGNDIVDLIGSLFPNAGGNDEDIVDYYGIPMMAGQTVRVQVIGFQINDAHVGVFDPDGRQVASTYNNLATPISGTGNTSAYTYNLPIQFTADRPGIYRVAVGEIGDVDFVGTPNLLGLETYELRITNLGAMALGGFSAANENNGGPGAVAGEARILDIRTGIHQIEVGAGDVGAVWATHAFNMTVLRLFQPTITPPPGTLNPAVVFGSIYVPNGNLRAVDVLRLGVGTEGAHTTGAGIDLNVPSGSVGLVQVRGEGLLMDLNPTVVYNLGGSFYGGGSGGFGIPPAPTTPTQFTLDRLAIGGSYQVINSPASRFTGGVLAKAGMGILRAQSINGISNTTYIYLDADNQGLDGKSDLIDITGSIDGPVLNHGPGGNFRYMRVGGIVGVDSFFGSSTLGYFPHEYGASASFVDDSGTIINVTPVGRPISNPLFNPVNPLFGPRFIAPQLSTLTYPVRSGGVIVMDVQSTRSVAINSTGGAFNSTAEISRIEVHGPGVAPLTTTRFTKNGYVTTIAQPFNNQALNNELSVAISGDAITDVAYISALEAEPGNSFFNVPGTVTWEGNLTPVFRSSVTAFSNLTRVSNNTGGEILAINALNLGELFSTGNVGVTRTTTIAGNSLNFSQAFSVGTAYAARNDAPVNPSADTTGAVGDSFPFNFQTFGIAIGGDIVSIVSNRAVGNIVATGLIGSIVANADGRNVADVFEGIAAPIAATGATSATAPNTPDGIPDGSILSVSIGEGIESAGSGDFARTGIFAGNTINSISGSGDIRGTIVFGQFLNSLNLSGGASLIDANILNVWSNTWASARESAGGGTSVTHTVGGVQRAIGHINIAGTGGIIGTLIAAASIGPINVPGFGIISSNISTPFSSTGISSITVGGYGVRDTIISVGTDLAVLNLTGNGKHLSTNRLPASVRQSESVRADPQLGFGFDPHSGRALTPLNDIHSALGTSQAAPTVPGATDTGALENSRIVSQRHIGSITAQTIRGDLEDTGQPLMRISAGNRIDKIQTRGLINKVQIVTGGIGQFLPASDVLGLTLTVSGPIESLNIKGSLGAGSVIEAIGPNGRIGNINIKRDLNGRIRAVQTIGTITVGRNLNGTIQVDALRRGGVAFNKLYVGGTMKNGSLIVGLTGNRASVGEIVIRKGLGASPSDSLEVAGNIGRLQVGGVLNMSVRAANIGTLQASRVNGPVRVGSNLDNLEIKKGGLHGNVNVGGRLRTANIAGGITSNVRANNGFGSVNVTRGNVASTASLVSGFGGLDSLRVQRGSLFGTVDIRQNIGQIIVSGDLGDGTNPMEIKGKRLGLLQVGGDINAGVSIRIRGPIDALVVGGDIESGALVQASALNRQDIDGNVFGSLVIG